MMSKQISREQYYAKAKPKPGMGKVNTKGVWIHSVTGQPCERDNVYAEHWDSWLEYRCYQKLARFYGASDIERQPLITVCHDDTYSISLKWRPDFLVKSTGVFIEVKGSWINGISFKDSKELFLWKLTICRQLLNIPIVVVSDEPFRIGKLDVITLDDYLSV